ncbi:MAG: carboxypeptidase-like regulatory domain-containing protein [Acidobacteriia bacterium]|nr:carboxypeptidase-like regulatory domain-containing protein [Terriglobia bacterium]
MAFRWSVVLCIVLVGLATVASAEITGIVVDENDRAVPNVTVYGSKKTCCPFKAEETRTDANGAFRLGDPGKVIYIRGEGFRPASRIVSASTTVLRIVLEPEQRTEWRIPQCDNSKSSRRRDFLPRSSYGLGYTVRLFLPKGATVKKTTDIDYVLYRVRFARTNESVEIWSGVNVGINGDPIDDWLVKSSEYSERRIGGASWGIDARGTSIDGSRWRSANMVIGSELVRYSGVSADAAAYFDAIIDSACTVPRPHEPSGY